MSSWAFIVSIMTSKRDSFVFAKSIADDVTDLYETRSSEIYPKIEIHYFKQYIELVVQSRANSLTGVRLGFDLTRYALGARILMVVVLEAVIKNI